MRPRNTIAILLSLVVALLAANVAIPQEFAVRVVTPPAIIPSLPHWVAEEKNIYADYRLRVETLNITGSDLMVQALISNDADVLPAVSLVDVANVSSRAPIKPHIFSHSRMHEQPPFEALIVMPRSPVATLRDLAGKRIAVYPGATAKAAVDLFLRKNGVATSEIQYQPLSPPEHLRALQRGDVEASHIYEPLRTANLLGGTTRMLSGSVYAYLTPESAIGVSAMSSKFYREHREAAEAYLQSWDRAIEFIRTHNAEAREILRRRLNLTPEVATRATWVDATKTTEVSIESVKATVEALKESRVIAPDVEIDAAFFLSEKRQ